ncbi:MAG: GGDEF domain-containing protein [Proteobacteria bacterium]|nr:GGDEF domain-containing protein [Pseudomonadota bacterium]
MDEPDPEADAALAAHVQAERVRFTFRQDALAILLSPIAALLVVFALWDELRDEVSAGAHGRLLTWAFGLGVLALGRLALVRAYPSTNPSGARLRRWEALLVGAVLVVALWWGVGALAILPGAGSGERAFVFAVLVLMAGAHRASHAAHPRTVLLGVVALVGPIALRFAMVGDRLHGALAIVAVLVVVAMTRSIHAFDHFFGRAHRLAHALQEARERSDALARTDPLTELHNRRAFYELGEQAVRLAHAVGSPLALVMLDLDHFKRINDRLGHATGDAVIRAVADVLNERLLLLHGRDDRATAIIGRLAGEEFVMLLPATDLAAATLVAEQLRAAVEAHALDTDDPLAMDTAVRFTTSVGVAGLRAHDTLDLLIARADAVLHVAKATGNRVVTAPI